MRLKRGSDEKKAASPETGRETECFETPGLVEEGLGQPDEALQAKSGEDQALSEALDEQTELEAAKGELQAAQDTLQALSAELIRVSAELTRVSDERDTWESKASKAYDQYLRVRSDMEGFRKRVERDFDDRLTRSMAGFMTNLLEVMDNFDRSIEALQASQPTQNGAGLEPFLKGVSMIRAQMLDVLSKEGVEPIPSPVGQIMDPALHEAVEAQEGGGEHGTVLSEVQKGYRFRNLILRATKVRVIR